MDFDGLVEMSAALLRDDPAIADELRTRWPRISVDEYQDIDAVQYDLLRMISGDGTGLTAIGDPDQAIYRFRGADVGIFGRFAADFPGATTVELTRNYRSSPEIVTAAMQAIAPTTLVPGRTAVAVRGGPAGVVTFDEAADEHAEAAWIAATIDQLLGGASFHSLDSGRADGHAHGKLGLSDIAVLYRTDAQAGPLGQALTRAGLPFQKRSHDLLARRSGVADIMREMRLVRTGPARPARRPGDDVAGQMDVAGQLTAAVRALASARGERDATVVDIRAAGELLTPLARRCGADLERFLAEISLGAETDALDPRAEAITLLTLHGAKGLEFDVVFLAGCERGLLPLRLAGPVADDAAEERRLLFVGMTRARDRLLLTCAARRSQARLRGGGRPVAVPDRGRSGAARPDRAAASAPGCRPPAAPALTEPVTPAAWRRAGTIGAGRRSAARLAACHAPASCGHCPSGRRSPWPGRCAQVPPHLSSLCTSRNFGCRASRSHSNSTISDVTISAPCCRARSMAAARSAGSREPVASAAQTTRRPDSEQVEHRLQDADVRLAAGHDDLAGPGGQQRGKARVTRGRERRLGHDRLRVSRRAAAPSGPGPRGSARSRGPVRPAVSPPPRAARPGPPQPHDLK